jgi:hypothetical protein
MKLFFAQAPSPSPTPVTGSTALSLETIGVLALLVPITGFLSKWVFDQAVKGWARRIHELERDIESLKTAQEKDLLLSSRVDLLGQRLENLGGALQDSHRLYNDTQKEFLKLQSVLGTDYVRREEWIRLGSTLDAKMDALNRKIDDRMESLFDRLAK